VAVFLAIVAGLAVLVLAGRIALIGRDSIGANWIASRSSSYYLLLFAGLGRGSGRAWAMVALVVACAMFWQATSRPARR
jgi:hypothetical protein